MPSWTLLYTTSLLVLRCNTRAKGVVKTHVSHRSWHVKDWMRFADRSSTSYHQAVYPLSFPKAKKSSPLCLVAHLKELDPEKQISISLMSIISHVYE
ncbi:hypothetical protein V8C34DRAFT_292216 [Trichoderma compactum]